ARLPRRELPVVLPGQRARLHPREPARDRLVVPPARGPIEGMRPRAQPQIRTPGPVALVVPRVESGEREIRDLVMTVPRDAEDRDQILIAREHVLCAGDPDRAPRRLGVERRALLDL